ncbi:MAG TPA: asparaginase [Gemmatimonadaceae bacterium]|nr:asparaginase [Gemmatimonadaceae bacterium]
MKSFALDVVATRGGVVESRHSVHAAVVDAHDALIGGAGDVARFTHWRSCAKPFQVMPFLQSGGFDDLHWGDDELALACASHGGEPEHVAIAERMLSALGLEEGDLACGPHEPLSTRGAKFLRDAGERPTRLHNNCSGKHAAMLAAAHTAGWPMFGYERPAHDVQRCCLTSVAHWTGLETEDIGVAVDGCGVTEFAMPLENMARAYSRLAREAERESGVASRVVGAIRTRPFLVGGSDRFDSILIEDTEGRVVAKIGAEGVHSAALLDQGIGVTIKVEDGSQRAQYPALVRLLQLLDALPEKLPARLDEYLKRQIRNTRGETVGEIRPLS